MNADLSAERARPPLLREEASLSPIQTSFLGRLRMPKEKSSNKGDPEPKAPNFPKKSQVHQEEDASPRLSPIQGSLYMGATS